jgi:hypothetical protein
MKLRILTHLSGKTNRFAGEVHETPDAEARRLIAAGFAEEVEEPMPKRKTKQKAKQDDPEASE